MWKVALVLVLTLIIVPLGCFYFDEPLSLIQKTTLIKLLYVYGAFALLAFLVSTVTDNYSQVDKLWSIMPIAYVWIVAVESHFAPRILLMAILVTIWGLRLTFNFARRGGYSIKVWEGEEDYRWSILRKRPGFTSAWKWTLFNFFFISAYQMALILLMTLPIVKSMDSDLSLTVFDYLLALLILILIAIEWLADQQQYDFQTKKYQQINEGQELSNPYKTGFVHTGLWAYMRHPNYMAEQGIWILFYFFSVIATGGWINWSIAGAILLIFLFKGSSDFSEEITAEKYPEYARYQKEVGRFLPIGKKYTAQ